MSIESVLRFSFSTPSDRVSKVLRELHLFASEQSFRGVSPVTHCSGKGCMAGEKDPLAAMKDQARGLALANGRLLTFLPLSFSAFGCQLPNKRLFFVGFAKYPDFLTLKSGQTLSTPWVDQSLWHGTVDTLDNRFIETIDDCRESHRLVCNLLKFAHELKVLKIVEDPTGCFDSFCGALNGCCEEELLEWQCS